jgi:hypothetical protein
MREDIKVWLTFLSEYNEITVIIDNAWASNETLELFIDSAGGQNRGFGIYFQRKWTQKCWPKEWEEMGILKDITFLELFPVVAALYIWGYQLKNKKIIFNIDNQSVVHIINQKSSKYVRVMSLVRHLVLSTLQYNIMIKALHISGISNKIADSLSRCDWQRFRNLYPEADQRGTEIPDHLWKL